VLTLPFFLLGATASSLPWGEFAEAEASDDVSLHSRSSEESVVILLVGMDVAYYSPPLTNLVQCLFTDILLVLLQEFYVSGKHP
jgi:hypothetical protein